MLLWQKHRNPPPLRPSAAAAAADGTLMRECLEDPMLSKYQVRWLLLLSAALLLRRCRGVGLRLQRRCGMAATAQARSSQGCVGWG